MNDMLDSLRGDPGHRTFGELAQERQWALGEILRLRTELGRMRHGGANVGLGQLIAPSEHAADRATSSLRLVRIRELKQLVGLAHSTIWKMTKEGRFPKPVHIGQRATAWRMGDILAWQDALSSVENR